MCTIFNPFDPCLYRQRSVLWMNSLYFNSCIAYSSASCGIISPICCTIFADPAPGATGFFVSLGDGAAFTTVDFGDLGDNPCDDTFPYIGAFRYVPYATFSSYTSLCFVFIKPTYLLILNTVAKIRTACLERLSASTPKSSGSLRSGQLDTGIHSALPQLEEIFTRVKPDGMSQGFPVHKSAQLCLYSPAISHSFVFPICRYTYEEINHIVKGKNYGWPCFEGPLRTKEYDGYDDTPVGQICVNMVNNVCILYTSYLDEISMFPFKSFTSTTLFFCRESMNLLPMPIFTPKL